MSGPTPDHSILEFAFAPNEGYLISTFRLPLRKKSKPLNEQQNLPTELSAEIDDDTRLLSVSIYRKGLWFLRVHRTELEHVLEDTRKLSSTLQDIFDNLKATSQSPRFVAFGESPGSFCMILNDGETFKLGVPQDCDSILELYNDALRRNRIRSDKDFTVPKGIALGAAGSWIIYDGNKHSWGGSSLPRGLLDALELGKKEKWLIKTAELSIFNPDEYFLVYQNGKVWYNVHQSFENKLRSVVFLWASIQELQEVTFTNVVSNEYIAYYELLKKILRSAIKAYPPLFNEVVVHYKRQDSDSRYNNSNVRNEYKYGGSPQTGETEIVNNQKFVQAASKVQVKRSQGTSTSAKPLTNRQIYVGLFSDLTTATFPAHSIVWRILGNFRSSNSLNESPLDEGKQRIWWTCGCGHKLYDDYEPLEPDALQELEDLLNQYGQGNEDSEKRTRNAQIIVNIWNWIKIHLSGSAIKPRVRGDSKGQQSSNVDVTLRTAVTQARRKPLHLLCCVPTGSESEGFTLRHEPLDDIANDKELFSLLRKVLYGRSSIFFSILSLKKAKSIGIVKFKLAPNNYVDVQDHSQSRQSVPCTCLPPIYMVEPSISATYRCEPIPASQHPPIGKNFLKHQFENPACQGKEETWFYNQVPKWTAGILRAPNSRRIEGWGIQIESELHQRKVKVMMLVANAVGALIIGLGYAYCTETPDLQTAFAIIAVWVVFCTMSFAVV